MENNTPEIIWDDWTTPHNMTDEINPANAAPTTPNKISLMDRVRKQKLFFFLPKTFQLKDKETFP